MTSQSVAALLEGFLRARQLNEPNSQPLYSYRANLGELKDLEVALQQELRSASLLRRCLPSTAQGFCLWAAEWWRRNHTGGHWRWEDMLTVLDREEFGPGGDRYSLLCRMVVVGLRRWKRDVLRTGHGRAFLVTLACEGGLPLKLVRREGASLRSYFRALLEEIRVFGRTTVPFPVLAERVQDRLPRSLRNQIVYSLSGELASGIWKLQEEVGEARDPVAELDRSHPGWRDRLPLLLSDEVATALLRNLLTDAAEVVHMGGRLRFERFLEPVGNAWALKGRFELPASLRPDEIEALFGQRAIERLRPAYFDLLMQPEDSAPALVAMAAPRHDPDSGEYFALEHTRLSSSSLGPASGARSLLARHRNFECASDDFRGASPLSDLPWVFSGSSTEEASRSLRFVGEGSVNIREPQAFVAAPAEWKPQGSGVSHCTPLGPVEGEDRLLYRVEEQTRFEGPEDLSVVVTPDYQGKSEVLEYRARGRSIRLGRKEERFFLGPPEVVAWRATGPLSTVPTEQLRWRPDASGAAWVPYGASAMGRGTLRLVRDGQIRCSLRIQIAPPAFEIQYHPGEKPGEGKVDVRGLAGGSIHVANPDRVDVTTERNGDSATIHLTAYEDPPETIDLIADWEAAGRLLLTVPFPSLTGGYLAPSGDRLPDRATIPKGRISGIRAFALVPNPHAEFFVECDYRGADLSVVQGWRPFIREPMNRISGGHNLLDLGSLHRQFNSLLGPSCDTDAHLRVLIQTNDVAGFPRCELRIGHYELHLENKGTPTEEWVPWVGQVVVGIRDEDCPNAGAIETDDLTVEAINLEDPTVDPFPLQSVGSWTWVLPRGLPPGEWLVTGRTGNLHRCGPIIVQLGEGPGLREEETAPPEKVEECDGFPRSIVRDLASLLAENPGHRAWEQVEGCAAWGPDIPAAAFPLLRAVARHPVAAAVGLLRHTSEEGFLQFWIAMESLPFWWYGLHLEAWRKAMAAYVEHLQRDAELLAEGGFELNVPEMLLGALTPILTRLPYLRIPLNSWGTELLSGPPTAPYSNLLAPRRQDEFLEERQSVVRGGTEALADLDALPDLRFVSESAGRLPSAGAWQRLWIEEGMSRLGTRRFDVLNSPVLGAACSVLGQTLRDSEYFRLRSVRELAPQWFDEVHRTSFLFALGVTLGESNGA